MNIDLDSLTRHADGHVCWLGRSRLNIWALGEPVLDGNDEGAPIDVRPHPSCLWTFPYHPMYLFLVNMAAIGSVLAKVPVRSPKVSFADGSW